jgi:acetolactate synthase-1/2/3 large subunit
MKMTGARAIMQALVENQVDVVFGYPGGAIMPLYDALYDFKDQVHHVLVRHEQGAVHAAEGYARACGKPGVCIATSGPGATNLITGITDAMMDSVPLVCITGQIGSPFLGTDAFQEADILSMTVPVTKWSVQVTSAEEIPACLAKAFYIAKSGRPGPVVVDITKDAQLGMLDFSYSKYEGKQKEVLKPDSFAIQEAAKLLNQSSRPYLLVGHGVLISGAEKEVRELAEKAHIPVASTLLGLSAFPTNHPLYAGMLGMHGNYGPNVLTNEADVILAVGMRFDDRVTGALEKYAKQAKIIHIDIDQSELDKNVKTAVPILADAKSALQALFPLVQSNRHPTWL